MRRPASRVPLAEPTSPPGAGLVLGPHPGRGAECRRRQAVLGGGRLGLRPWHLRTPQAAQTSRWCGGRAGWPRIRVHPPGAGLTTGSAQLRDPRRSETDPVFPSRQRAPSSRHLRLGRGLLQTSRGGPQLGAGNTARTRGSRARGQFTLRAPRTAQPWHSGQGPDGPVGEAPCPPPPRMGVRSPQTRLPCRPLVTLGTPGDTRPGGPVAPRPEDTETQCWRSTRAQALPPAHVLSTPPRLGWTSQAGARRSQGTEVRPPQAGKSQLQDSAQRGHPGGAHEAPSRAVTVIFGKRGCSPYSSCGVGPSARARLPLCPSSWPGWG